MPFQWGEFRDPRSPEPFTCAEIVQDMLAAVLFFAAVTAVLYVIIRLFQ